MKKLTYTIQNIRYGRPRHRKDGPEYLYAHLLDGDGNLVMSATLDVINDRLRELCATQAFWFDPSNSRK